MKQTHLLFFAFAVLAVVILWEIRQRIPAAPVAGDANPAPNPELSNVPTRNNSAEAPYYLTYNQPYAFAPPIVSTLPETTSGQIGQSSQTLVLGKCGGC